MPSKKKKYNSRFPPARIKKIMQSDEDVGKVAQVVPIIISKALEIFVASLLRSSSDVTRTRNARTLTPSHIKASILSDNQFHFLRDLAQSIPDVNTSCDDEEDTNNTGNTTPNTLTVTAPRLQRKTSSTTTTSTRSSSTTTGRTRGRPRKRPIESQQTSLSSLQHIEEHEHEEQEEEDDDDEEDDEDDEEEDEEEDDDEEEQSKQ